MSARNHPHLAASLRILFGGIWLAGAIFNLAWTLPNPEMITGDLGENATFAPYRWLFGDLVAANPTFWIIALVVGELALAALLFSGGMRARIGVWASLAWSVFLFFAILPYTLMMFGFAAGFAWLLGEQHPRDLLEYLRHRVHLGHEGGTA